MLGLGTGTESIMNLKGIQQLLAHPTFCLAWVRGTAACK